MTDAPAGINCGPPDSKGGAPASPPGRRRPTPGAFHSGRKGALLGEVTLPYKIATLLYCFDDRDNVLLIRRAQEPNRGLHSPPGGKLKTDIGESPYACACREAHEETGLSLAPSDLHLTGLVSEHGYQGQTHWLMFLFEVRPRLRQLPPPHREGVFGFHSRAELALLELPDTDREQIWPLFWSHRDGFFAAHVHVHPDGRSSWTLEQSSPRRRA